jgi:5-hydroxyisourate hydrolase
MSPITTHILDVTRGKPAANVSVRLDQVKGDLLENMAEGKTNLDGRLIDWWKRDSLSPGLYQLRFATAGYFDSIGCKEYFYPEVTIRFQVSDPAAHYHVPLLISPFGYSTYRGS